MTGSEQLTAILASISVVTIGAVIGWIAWLVYMADGGGNERRK